MNWKPGSGRLRFILSFFLGYFCLVAFFLVFYLKIGSLNNRHDMGAIILFVAGALLSIAAGFFVWSLDARSRSLQQKVIQKSAEVLQKNSETKKAEIASAAIYEAARFLFSDVQFDGLLEKIMNLVSKVVYIDEGSLMLFDSNRELYIAASRGIPDEIVRSVHIGIGERVAGRVAQERRDYLIVDGLDKYPEFEGLAPNPRIKSSILCPLICQQEFLGVLSLNRTTTLENFAVADLMNVSIFASQIAQAIRNAYLYKSLEEKVAELESVNRKLKAFQSLIR